MVDKYEDPFVRIASMIGGDEYLKVARSLLKAEDATDEEIASSTGLRINMVRKVLYDLFGKSLITGIRVKDERKGWFVYRWRTRREEVEHFIENQKKKRGELLGTRQTGLAAFRIALLPEHEPLLIEAQTIAADLYQSDPDRARALMQRWAGARADFARV